MPAVTEHMESTAEYWLTESEEGFGTVFVPRGPWRSAYNDLMETKNVQVIRLSYSAGWREADVGFLAQFPNLRGAEIYSWEVRDVSVLERLSQLRVLGLECDLRKPVDLSKLPMLEVVFATWKKALDSLFQCSGLWYLNVVNWPAEDLQPLAAMAKLERLRLSSRKLLSDRG